MRKVTLLPGVRVTGAGALPRLSVSDDELALAAIPGMKMWLEPGEQFRDPATYVLTERANGVKLAPESLTDPTRLPTLGTFANGSPCLECPTPITQKQFPETPIAANPTEWTAVAVIHASSTVGNGHEILSAPVTTVDPDYSLRFGINSSGVLRLWQGDVTPRIDDAVNNYLEEDVLVMATFSTREGLKLYRNGVLVATNAADKAPLTIPEVKIGQAGTGPSSGTFNGKLGHVLLLDIDLSWPEYANHKANLDSILLNHYGIS